MLIKDVLNKFRKKLQKIITIKKIKNFFFKNSFQSLVIYTT